MAEQTVKKTTNSSTNWGKNIISSMFWRKTWLAAHSGKKHDWQHIQGKNMIGSTFWEHT
jgi:hypothetical protein